ncbi:MAG: ABC transporter permease [Anaerovoracaceae bacterium]|jgi:teichoic acid transport system permease protein
MKLAKSDIIKTYRGAAFGWAWAIIKPSVTIFVYWFAFSVGLRHGKPVNGYPWFLWFIAGMIPWFYMKDAIVGGAGAIRRYRFLVLRIKFPVDTIPTFVNLASFAIDCILIAIMVLLYWIGGYPPTIYLLQLPLYMLMMLVFFNMWSIFASMLSAISADFLNLVKSFVTALFWMSGIIYDATGIQTLWIRRILMVNPVTIIVNGFRYTLVYHRWFWEFPHQMRNYCILLVIMTMLACWAYKKLVKDIPDVL